MGNFSSTITEESLNTSDKEVGEMGGNWSLKICVVSFLDDAGMTLEFLHQQMRSLSTHSHQLLLVALIHAWL